MWSQSEDEAILSFSITRPRPSGIEVLTIPKKLINSLF